MELNLHANATTTPKTRSYIQRSKKSVVDLAAELGVSETTIYRWRSEPQTAPLATSASISPLE
jgi:transposase-like protein